MVGGPLYLIATFGLGFSHSFKFSHRAELMSTRRHSTLDKTSLMRMGINIDEQPIGSDESEEEEEHHQQQAQHGTGSAQED